MSLKFKEKQGLFGNIPKIWLNESWRKRISPIIKGGEHIKEMKRKWNAEYILIKVDNI